MLNDITRLLNRKFRRFGDLLLYITYDSTTELHLSAHLNSGLESLLF